MFYLCQDCTSDQAGFEDHYSCHLCMDCYNRRREDEDRENELSAEDWDEFLSA